jgi:formamidopyrimidine-DNA glycosylase
MPEGVEVTIMMRCVHNLICGKRITKFSQSSKSKMTFKGLENSDLESIFPLTVVEVSNNGKLSWIEMKDEQTDMRYWLIQSYGLKGGWNNAKTDHSRFSITIQDDENNSEKTLYYNDSINYGNQLFTNDVKVFQKKLKERGIDLSGEFTYTQFSEKLNTLRKSWNICAFLMEQKYLSGIGNYLKCEILHEAKLSPHRDISKLYINMDPNDNRLTGHESQALYNAIAKVYSEALSANGGTYKYCDLIPKDECTFKCKVYNKEIDENGNTITCEKTLDKRKTFWVVKN